MVRCPVCGKRFELAGTPAPPFCSTMCRKIDLGRWLGETYALPVERDEEIEPDDGPPVPADDED